MGFKYNFICRKCNRTSWVHGDHLDELEKVNYCRKCTEIILRNPPIVSKKRQPVPPPEIKKATGLIRSVLAWMTKKLS